MKVLAAPALALYPALILSTIPSPSHAGRWQAGAVITLLTLVYALLRSSTDGLSLVHGWILAACVFGTLVWALVAAARGAALPAVALVLLSLALSAAESHRLVGMMPTRLPPDIAKVTKFLSRQGHPGDVVAAEDWGRGYLIQRSSGLPTVTDGLLESNDVRQRIAEFARVLYSEQEADLNAFCIRYGVRFIWVSGAKRQAYARYAGVEYDAYFAGAPPTARGQRTNYVRLLAAPEGLECIRSLALLDKNRILEFDPGCAVRAGAER
jgi:hypothetical protein